MQDIIDAVIPFIIGQQETNGSFPTYESYPIVNPSAGWTKLPDPSPFITANILFALMEPDDDRLNDVIAKGAKSLIAAKEGKGFWRFWPVKSKQHPVPLDMDDTCIGLAVLARCGYNFDVKDILLNNKNAEGYFETWLRPRLSTFFISPVVFYNLLQDYRVAAPTQKLEHFAYTDFEPAVAANVLLYLGENHQTKACIDLIVNEIKSGSPSKKFYDDDIVVYYHLSRAYVNGVHSFKQLGPIIAERICSRFGSDTDNENGFLRAMAANVLLDYGVETAFAGKLIDSIAQGELYPDKWLSYPYFCSRDRNFLAGSPALTSAVFIEACAKLNRNKLI